MKFFYFFGYQLVVICGVGDIVSGVVLCLYYVGFKVIMLEVEKLIVICCIVVFVQVVFDGEMMVEGVIVCLVISFVEVMKFIECGFIFVMVDFVCLLFDELKLFCVVDVILVKQNLGMWVDMVLVIIVFGLGFIVGKDCYVVIEINCGYWFGQVIYFGCVQENIGVSGNIMGYII